MTCGGSCYLKALSKSFWVDYILMSFYTSILNLSFFFFLFLFKENVGRLNIMQGHGCSF